MKKIKIRVNLKTKTFFVVGMGGILESGIHIFFARTTTENGDFKIYVPGSTIKGILRKNAMSIAHTLNMKACYSINPSDLSECISSGPCDVCDVFGGPNYEGRLYVRSANLDDVEENLMIVTRTEIDYKTGRVVEGSLYSGEYLPPETKFSFEMVAYLKNEDEEKLIVRSIDEMNYQRFGRAGAVEVESIEILEGELGEEALKLANELGLEVRK